MGWVMPTRDPKPNGKLYQLTRVYAVYTVPADYAEDRF